MEKQHDRMIGGKLAKQVLGAPDTFARVDGTIWYRSTRGKSKGKFLKRKTSKSNKGYETLKVGSKENYKTKNLHIVMLEAWFGRKPKPAMHGCHWDGNKSNNKIENLRWANAGQIENVKDALPNSFFDCSNASDTWFHMKSNLIAKNPNTKWKKFVLDKPVKLENNNDIKDKDVAYG